jgi:hypothetical protein
MRIAVVIVALSGLAGATTLQQLTTDDMVRQSTAIVRVQVTGSTPVLRGRNIYTQYQFTVLETLKTTAGGQSVTSTAVFVPGGAIQGIRQMVAGAPALASGQQFVIFLWTGKSGLTQIIGLSQGLFNVMQDASGNAVLVRPAIAATMVNQNGTPVTASAVTMSLSALRAEIQTVLGAGN